MGGKKMRGTRLLRQFSAAWVHTKAEAIPPYIPMDLISSAWLATLPPAVHNDLQVKGPLFESGDMDWILWLSLERMEKNYEDIDISTVHEEPPLKKVCVTNQHK